jgi:hypothetical protein
MEVSAKRRAAIALAMDIEHGFVRPLAEENRGYGVGRGSRPDSFRPSR